MRILSDLPINKWNLQFTSQELEDRYQSSEMPFQILFHKIMMTCGTMVCLICLIVFVAQNQPLIIILQMVASLVAIFSQLLLSNFIIRYVQKIYALNYFSCILVGQYISKTGTNVNQYILGHTYCIILICCLRLCNNKLKGFYLLITPVSLLIIQDIAYLDNLYLVLNLIEGTVCLTFIIYLIEYQARSAFFNNFMTEQYANILKEFTINGIFALSLDQRSQQFNLEFHNKHMDNYCEITDEVSRKGFLRNSYIVDYQHNESLFKRNAQNRMNLEDYLFQKINGDPNISENKKIIYEQQGKSHQFQVKLKIIQLQRKVIFMSLQNNMDDQFKNQQQQQKNKYHQIIVNQSLEISTLQKLMLEKLTCISNHDKQQQLNYSLKCVSLLIRNVLNNYLVFFQQEKLLQIIQKTKSQRFYDFIDSMGNFFQNQSEAYQKEFKLINQLPYQFTSNINFDILSQILINVFQEVLQESKFGTTISLIITITKNLNPLQTEKQEIREQIITKNEDTSTSNMIGNQFLIQFSFFFESEIQQRQVHEIPIQGRERNRNYQISASVTNILLGKIGPYRSIINNEVQNFQNNAYTSQKQFFIYSDISLLDQISSFKSVQIFL